MKVTLAILAVLACALTFSAAPEAAPRAASLLPDIDQGPVGCPGGWKGDPMTCQDWDVCLVRSTTDPNDGCVTGGDARAVRQRFTTPEDTAGVGLLLVYGGPDSHAQNRLRIRHPFARADV